MTLQERKKNFPTHNTKWPAWSDKTISGNFNNIFNIAQETHKNIKRDSSLLC